MERMDALAEALPAVARLESEALRQRWIASPGHQRVWPPIERFIKTQGSYPVVLYDEM